MARLAQLLDELRADEAAPADDNDLHLTPFVVGSGSRPLGVGRWTCGEDRATAASSNPPTRQPGSPVACRADPDRSDWHGGVAGVPSVRSPMAIADQNTLRGRDSECATLDRLLDAVRGGESRALVLRGEPGVGKTALLEYAIGAAPDLRVLRAAGVESETELAFASLQQLCAPMLDRLERLPGPQQDALRVAFGLSGGQAPDRFLVGLAALSLLSDVAEERPLLCALDDAQWLDGASALALAFVARRLLAEPLAIVFVTREPIDALSGLPELVLRRGRGRRCRRVAGLCDPGTPGRAGPRDDPRRDTREPARASGTSPRLDAGGACGRVRAPRRTADGPHRAELPPAGSVAPASIHNGCCSRRRRSRSATSPCSGALPSDSGSDPTQSGQPRLPA